MYSRIWSALEWIFSSLALIRLVTRRNLFDGNKFAKLKPLDNAIPSLANDINASKSWPLLPNAVLHVIELVKEKSFPVKLISPVADDRIASIRFKTSSSWLEEKNWTFLMLRSSEM